MGILKFNEFNGQDCCFGDGIDEKKKMSAEAREWIGKKIAKLKDEGKENDQAVAIAYSMARKRGFDVPEE
jgi:hypothetical protein